MLVKYFFEIHGKDHVFGLLGSAATKKAGNFPILTKNLLKISSGFRLINVETSCGQWSASLVACNFTTIPSTSVQVINL